MAYPIEQRPCPRCDRNAPLRVDIPGDICTPCEAIAKKERWMMSQETQRGLAAMVAGVMVIAMLLWSAVRGCETTYATDHTVIEGRNTRCAMVVQACTSTTTHNALPVTTCARALEACR